MTDELREQIRYLQGRVNDLRDESRTAGQALIKAIRERDEARLMVNEPTRAMALKMVEAAENWQSAFFGGGPLVDKYPTMIDYLKSLVPEKEPK